MFSEIRKKLPFIVSFIIFSILLVLLQNQLNDTHKFTNTSWSFEYGQYINHTDSVLSGAMKSDIQTHWQGQLHFYEKKYSAEISITTNNEVTGQHFEYDITANGQWQIADGVLSLSAQNITELKPTDSYNKNERFGLQIFKNIIKQQFNQSHSMHFYDDKTLVLNNVSRKLILLNKM